MKLNRLASICLVASVMSGLVLNPTVADAQGKPKPAAKDEKPKDDKKK